MSPPPGPTAAAARAVARAGRRDELLLTPLALAALRRERADVVLLEVGCGDGDAYRDGHVPGAVHVDTNLVERPPLWRLVPDAELVAFAERHGIGRRSIVVVYGEQTMVAARVVVALLYLGVEDVRLLDGGAAAWRAAGLPLETTPHAPRPADRPFGPAPGRPELIVRADDVRAWLGERGTRIVCTRSPAEHAGQVSGYPELSARGRIRGSVWGRSGSDADHAEALEEPDGTLRDPRAVAEEWRAHGIESGDRVVFYCGTGWRASLALLHAWLLGWQRIALYDPGWFEWSADPTNPVEVGPPAR